MDIFENQSRGENPEGQKPGDNNPEHRLIIFSMKSALLQYPYGEVFEPLEKICKKKGYSKITINRETGVIHARKGIQLFNNLIDLDVHVERVDEYITRINIVATSVKVNSGGKELEEVEEKFVDTIYKFF